MRYNFIAACVMGLCALPNLALTETPQKLKFRGGTCDASAAVRISDSVFLSANDETNVLRSFDLADGKLVAEHDVSSFLPLVLAAGSNPNRDHEVDIEAATRAGEAIWWIGSHGRDSDATEQPNRRMLFATNVPKPDLTDLTLVREAVDLTGALKASDKLWPYLPVGTWTKAPKKGGINIEGLVMTPEGHLLLGLRAPLSVARNHAIVVRMAHRDAAWIVADVHSLDLRGRGIRDIAADGKGYLLIAGPIDKPRGDKTKRGSLYRWDGVDQLTEYAPRWKKARAEALVRYLDHWLVLNDDGGHNRDIEQDGAVTEENCEDVLEDDPKHPQVYFRGKLFPATEFE